MSPFRAARNPLAELVRLTRAKMTGRCRFGPALYTSVSRGRALCRGALGYTVPRLIAPRLPAMLFRYDDGRSFALPAGDASYSQLFTAGEFEPAETDAVRRLLKSGDFALDVGANLGWFTVVDGHGRWTARPSLGSVEPMPGARQRLLRRTSLAIRSFASA